MVCSCGIDRMQSVQIARAPSTSATTMNDPFTVSASETWRQLRPRARKTADTARRIRGRDQTAVRTHAMRLILSYLLRCYQL